MRIGADGTWYYLKTPIGRLALVKLFASVLKREGDKYFLVTPVEKFGIAVDDVPFLAVELTRRAMTAGTEFSTFRTNVDDWVTAGPVMRCTSSQKRPAACKPYLHVRRDLWAKVTRTLFYDLVELGEERDIAGRVMFGVVSNGEFFAMADAERRPGVCLMHEPLRMPPHLSADEFFARARERLTLETPPALNDPNVIPRRGDHDVDPVMEKIAAVRPIRPAAVLVGIVDHPEPAVLLTQRAQHLPDHPGQISFPGGKIDKTDHDPMHSALREAEEEIGLARENDRAGRLS